MQEVAVNTGGRVGPKGPATSTRAVCASQHQIVTQTMLDVMRDGGNAADAAMAGCIVQAVVQQDMTNHAGTVTVLMYEAATGQTHELNSMGTVVPGLPTHHRVPGGHSLYAPLGTRGPFAVIPGFMPGMKAIHERFGSLPWRRLVEPAVHWATEGHEVTSFEHLIMAQTVDFFLYTESGRAHFTPHGHIPQVGDRWVRPELAKTMRKLAEEGPDHFISGEWARHFVERANELGWNISLEQMAAIPPRWGHGTRYRHGDHEIVQLSPPERQAVFCALVLGILDEIGIRDLGHYTESGEALYYFAHALRRAAFECGYVNDPEVFADAAPELTSRELHRLLAAVLKASRPTVDLTEHVKLAHGPNALVAGGLPAEAKQPAGSCELSIVDPEGNWVQMMNTLQSGGIPGEVVDGVCMVGSHGITALSAGIGGWLTGGGRMRSVIGNTIVLKEGKPVLSLGTPGNVHCTMPQVLSNILDYGMDPYAAEDAPRMLPLEDDYTVKVESRLPQKVVRELAALGVAVEPLPRYDYHMGSFQMSWHEGDGSLKGCAGPRRAGLALGL